MSTEPALSVPTSIYPSESIKKATFWQRFSAHWLDAAFVGGIYTATSNFVLDKLPTDGLWWIVPTLVNLAITAAYFIIPYSTTGQTFAKSIFKLKVVRADGSPLSWHTGVLRTLGYAASDILLIGYLWSVWDKDKQTWHDKIAGTYVVPASFDPAVLRETANPSQIQEQQRRWIIGLSLPAVAVIGCALAATIALTVPQVSSSLEAWLNSQPWYESLGNSEYAQLQDEDYAVFYQAFSDKCNADVHVTACYLGIDIFSDEVGNEAANEYWLTIDLSYDVACNSTSRDPCERLVDDYARLAFDTYAKVDQLTGMRISITNESSVGFVDVTITPIEKSFTIEEWRKELGIK